MPKRIKLMADYRCFPLWDQSGDFPPNIDPHMLHLSLRTIEALLEWANRYDATLYPDDPAMSGFRTSSEAQEFENQGLQLWRTLQNELGTDYEVSYFSNQERRLLSPSNLVLHKMAY